MKNILKIIKTNYIKYLFIVGLLLLTIGAGSYGYDYMRVKGLMAEGKQLSQTGKYKDAIGKLSIAESKWSPEAVKIEIATEISKNKELAESNDNFEQGKIQYEGENYERAIEYFDQIIISDENYRTAQSYKEIAKKKSLDVQSTNKDSIAKSTNTLGTVTTAKEEPIQIIEPTTEPVKKDEITDIANTLVRIGGLYKYIDQENNEIQKLIDEENKYNCGDKYSSDPSVIYSPEQLRSLIDSCRNMFSPSHHSSNISSAKNEISYAKSHIQEVIIYCGNQCVEAYYQSIKLLKEKGFEVQ